MTREEAIAELKADKELYETDICHANDGSPDGRLLEALDMAIEALSAENPKVDEPIIQSGDLISRADVKAEATKFFGHWVVFENRIDNLPSVPSADRPQGEWIEQRHTYDFNYYYSCSLCHKTINDPTNYCPNCGADMRGEK